MLSSKRAGLLSAVLILGPQLTQPRLLSLRDRGLGDQPAENDLAGRVEPVAGQRIDDFTPYALLDGIQVRRWLRTAPPRDAGDDSERGCGLAGHGRNSPSRWKLARNPRFNHVSARWARARRGLEPSEKFYPPPGLKEPPEVGADRTPPANHPRRWSRATCRDRPCACRRCGSARTSSAACRSGIGSNYRDVARCGRRRLLALPDHAAGTWGGAALPRAGALQ